MVSVTVIRTSAVELKCLICGFWEDGVDNAPTGTTGSWREKGGGCDCVKEAEQRLNERRVDVDTALNIY